MNVRIDRPEARGLAFTRLCIAMALGDGQSDEGAQIAAHRWGEESMAAKALRVGGPMMFSHQKGNVQAGATVSGNWAEALVSFDGAALEFFNMVRERSLLGRIPGLRKVPLNTKMIAVASGFTGVWIGEGQAKPVSSATFDDGTLPPLKVAALGVVTEELLRSTDPASEMLIRNELLNALVDVIDASFLDPNNSGTPNVEPESITANAVEVPIIGTGDFDDLRESIAKMVRTFGGDLERAVWVGHPALFAYLASSPLEFPGIGIRGGTLLGAPAVPSKALPTDAGADIHTTSLVLLDPDGVMYGEADMGVRVSTQGTVQMLDNPTQNSVTPTGTSQVSLWQTNSVGIMPEKFINWEVARAGAVSILTGIPGAGAS